jgi:hypothetical protein
MSEERIRELRGKAARARKLADDFAHDRTTWINLRKYADELGREADALERAPLSKQ